MECPSLGGLLALTDSQRPIQVAGKVTGLHSVSHYLLVLGKKAVECIEPPGLVSALHPSLFIPLVGPASVAAGPQSCLGKMPAAS